MFQNLQIQNDDSLEARQPGCNQDEDDQNSDPGGSAIESLDAPHTEVK